MYAPFNYDKLTMLDTAYMPASVKYLNTRVYDFWVRSLFQRAMSVIQINVPVEWSGRPKDFLYFSLFRRGFVAVFRTSELGTVFNPCTLSGFDFYYLPTQALVANPALDKSLNLTIGEDCELLKLTPDYMGCFDIICYYAEKLASLDGGINMSIINSKFSWLMGAKNKTAANTLKKILDKIHRGEPAVIFDEKLMDDPATKGEPWQFLERTALKQNYITTDQLMDFQTILNNFDSEIGIPTIPYQKKERMVMSEAESRQIDSTSRSVVWFDSLTESANSVNEMFDLDISVQLRYNSPDQEGGAEDGDE